MEKKYLVRVYVFKDKTVIGDWLHWLMDEGEIEHINTVLGDFSLICFYDIRCSMDIIKKMVSYRAVFLPLNNFEDFIIETPEGDLIDDDMILRDYSSAVQRGFNIKTKYGYCTAIVRLR